MRTIIKYFLSFVLFLTVSGSFAATSFVSNNNLKLTKNVAVNRNSAVIKHLTYFFDVCYRINYNPITGKAKVTTIPCPKP